MWHQMIWFVRIFVLDFQLWLPRPSPRRKAGRTEHCQSCKRKQFLGCILPRQLFGILSTNPCGKWRVELLQSLESHHRNSLFWRFQVHQRGGQFPWEECANRKTVLEKVYVFFIQPQTEELVKKLPCVQDLRIAWWTCLSVDGFVYWLWNLWMFLLTHLHLYTQVPPITFFNGETMSKIWNEITWTIWMYLNWYLNCIPTLGPLIPKQNDTQDPHPQVIGSLRSCCWEEPGRSLHQPRNLGWKFWNRGYNLIQRKHWGDDIMKNAWECPKNFQSTP